VNGNISADPLFTRPVSGNFHVRPGSPVVDAGTSESAPAVDLERNPRPTEGNGDGVAAFDMGAYEGTMAGTDPDLRATLTNNVSGSVLFPNPWIWSIEVANHGAGSACGPQKHDSSLMQPASPTITRGAVHPARRCDALGGPAEADVDARSEALEAQVGPVCRVPGSYERGYDCNAVSSG
jgi:hypothetical protein